MGVISDAKPLVKPMPKIVSRRAVLGGAMAAGVAVAGARLAGVGQGSVLGIPGIDPARTIREQLGAGQAVGWASPLDQESARVAHLLRRTTFGASGDDLEHAFSAGYAKTVDRLLESPPASPPPFPVNEGAKQQIQIVPLQQWWIDHMLATPTPLGERMTLFWHGHFTSDYRKVGVQQPYIYWQNLTWRRMALTNLRSMLMAVTTDPGMGRYLDLATSTGRNPNENYSRELMELFTMGPGNYSEDDVRNGAKLLAGWREPKAGDGQVLVFDPKRAYTGPAVSFLGQTGKLDAQGVIDRILAQPATAPFIVTKVLQRFVTPNPDTGYVNRLVSTFRSSGYDVKTLMRNVLTSPEFVSGPTYRALVKDPVEFAVHTLRVLKAPKLAKLAVASSREMGQTLFDPPDVGGWPYNGSWVSSNTMLGRINFVTAVLSQLKTFPAADQIAKLHLDGVLSPSTRSVIASATSDRDRWALVLMSPEFQLK